MEKAIKIDLFSLKTVHMRTFHLTWLAFFLCFFGWFAHAPLLNVTIGPDLGLSKAQKITAFIGSVGITIIARLLIGYLCDRVGPRKSYVALLVFGAIAVAGSSFAYNWETYLFSRLCIGVIGASFVITQYHTSVMFAPNVVGIANATTAGWGNQDRFGLAEGAAGLIASLFGLMNIFARSLGGWLGEKFAGTGGLTGRVRWLVVVMIAEGLSLLLFSRMGILPIAVATMILFSLFVQMAEGATFSVVPFINKRSLGAVSGIVGAGGNVGAVCYAQFLLRSDLPLQDCFFYFGFVVAALGALGLGVRFNQATEAQAKAEFDSSSALARAV